MNRKTIFKILVDITMTVLLFFCMSFQFMEQMNHEIFGTVLFASFLLHHALNWRWYVNLGKGKYTNTRILTTVIDFVILIDMFALMFSGMRMSGYVFKWLPLHYSMELARTLHMTASYGGFLLLGIHIGLHYGMIRGMIKKAFHLQENNMVRIWIFRVITTWISVYGVVALIQRKFFDYIFGRMHFVLFDYGEPVWRFEADLFAIMVLTAVIGYGLQKLVSETTHKK